MPRKTKFTIPAELKYTKLHEWVRIEGNVLTIGITDFAQYQMKDINSIIDPLKGRDSILVGTELEALSEEEYQLTIKVERKTSTAYISGKTIAWIDSSKGIFYAYSPVKGRIVEVNTLLSDFGGGEIVNKDSYGQGWFAKIEISDPAPLEKLLDAEGYRKFIRGE